MRTFKVLISLALFASLLLTACAGGETPTAPATPAAAPQQGGTAAPAATADDPLELTFFFPVNVGGPIAAIVEEIAAEFNEANPHLHVTPVYTGNYDDTIIMLQTAIQGGNPPDFFVSLANQRFTKASTNMATSLDHFIAADPDGEEFIADLLPGFLKDSFVEGRIYSIPWMRSTMVLFYNKDAFREVGLDPNHPPQNWVELADFSQRLTRRDAAGNVERFGVGIALNSGSAQWGFTGFALQNSENGENLMTEDGLHTLFYTPGNIEALQFWYDLQNVYQSMQPGIVQWTDLPGQFIEGEVAMIYHTTGNLTNIDTHADFEFGVAFLPAGRRFGAPTGGGNFYISADISPERQQAAWDFIRHATSTDWAARWSVETGFVAIRYSAFETDIMIDFYERLPQARVAKEQLAVAGPELTTFEAPRIWRILNDNIQSAIMGDATPAEALRNAQAEADEVLSRFR